MRKMTEWRLEAQLSLGSVVAVHGGPFKPLSFSPEAAGLVKIKAFFQHEGTAALSL